MAEDHPFTFQIEPDLSHDGRSRWRLYQTGAATEFSVVSYATKREAEIDATQMMARRIANWRTGKRQGATASVPT
jgi:hypothetical protein